MTVMGPQDNGRRQQQQMFLFQSQRTMPQAPSTSLDSTAQIGIANNGDWQEEVYQKILTMKETYLPELNEMWMKIADRLQQHDNLPQQFTNEQVEKLKFFKTIVEGIMTFLQVSKNNILPTLEAKLESYEKKIVNLLNANRPRKPGPSMQQPQQLLSPQMHQQQQSQISNVQSRETPMSCQVQSMNVQDSVDMWLQNNIINLQNLSLSSLSGVPHASQTLLGFTDQTENANSVDWQEEVYQKILIMKEAYLPGLSEMYMKIAGRLQQHDNLPQQFTNEQVEKLKIFKTIVERIMTFLQVSKNNILPTVEAKLESYEKQIVNRPQKPGPSMQQLLSPQMHRQQQSQISNVQSHENPMSCQYSR